jgi:hypothetical protein
LQAWSFLPPLFFDGVQLPYSDTFKYLGMVCDRQMNLNIASDAALRPFMAGTFRVKQFVMSHDLANKLHGALCKNVAWSLCNSTGFALQCIFTVLLPNATVPQ